MGLPRPVWMLGWVSFFTDTASEMIYPLLPLFLTRVLGAGAMSLGVIEGAAEAANSALKIVSGRLADRWGAPKPLVVAGYAISSAVRPFIGAASTWVQVLGLRFVDRLGKGIRGAPRDAMLAAFADASNRGRVFGFHRAMDHAGAVCGPLIASAFLFFYPGEYRTLFALAIVPGAVVVLILLRVPPQGSDLVFQHSRPSPPGSDLVFQPRPGGDVRDLTPTHVRDLTPAPSPRSVPLPATFYKAMLVIVLFSLGNASDAFLLLRFADVGIAAFWIPFLWSALHVVKTASSVVGGGWSDRFGRRRVIALGWLLYAAVYGGFAMTESAAVLIAVFLIYGLYFGLTEGVEKAWVADLAPAGARGNAFGIYNAVLGAGSLAASLLFGALWTRVSPRAAFYTGAGFALAATALLYLMFSPGRGSPGKDHETNPGDER
jgi:MFS family permease